ncbi:group III truncated hemoglobin [Marixanthomonas spongiae]|uniref:Globin n=1 Tax=Marixanthomonas spongiae TaxID=2174845 RepID=A0A2U0HYF3_9FLAO|nr:group III truncated hemoglobin [Marixanthomonas spongiae]PVW13884.1 globin [Marixanthomonas spongiae]
MEKTEIRNREDVNKLVTTFYASVRKDDLLGPIFNTIITDWDEHLEKLTDFWESNLFFKKKYKGNPLAKHVEVDQHQNGTINEKHFGTWINLWLQTIDNLFVGEVAQLAKNRARNMGTFMHLKIFEARMTKPS